MKLMALSDPHLLWHTPAARLDDAHAAALEKFEFVVASANELDARLLVAGDLFDKPRSWYLLPEVISIVKKLVYPIICVFGQHDQYMYSKSTRQSTNLGLLSSMGLVQVPDPFVTVNGVKIWGASFGEDVPRPDTKRHKHILVIHESICNENPGCSYLDASQFAKDNSDYDLIVCGDIHRKFKVDIKGTTILNSGPLVRKDAIEYNFSHKPGYWLIETSSNKDDDFSITWYEVPHKPAEEVLSRDHIEVKKHSDNLLDEFLNAFSTESVEEGSDVNFNQVVKQLIYDNSIGQEVVDLISYYMGKEDSND